MRPNLVFSGPTLSHTEAMEELEAIYLPPAVQGSIVAAVKRFDPRAILLIDGGFQSEPAIRHKEILWALSLGIPVIGAASMGALRAAELFPHMQGAGLIYRWYRRYPFAPDDAVAVLYGPPEMNFAPLTQALVDLRMTFRAAQRQQLISSGLRTKLDSIAHGLNFRDRTLARIVSGALPHQPEAAVEKCRATLAAALIQQKKKDALAALLLLRNEAYAAHPALKTFSLTVAFARDLEDAGLTL
jgi:hypothetical protein